MIFKIIYKTINLINSKIYVGKHIQYVTSGFDGYLGSGKLLQYAINKYGEENFKREIIEYVTSANINEREIFWIAELSATNPKIGYNITEGGDGIDSNTALKISSLPKIKLIKSKILKDRWNNIETRKEIIKKLIEAQQNPEEKNRKSKMSIKNWKNIEYRLKQTENNKEIANRTEIKEKVSKRMIGNKIPAIFNYILKSPIGDIFETMDLKSFCKQHGLNQGHMAGVCNNKINQYKKWTCISKTLRKNNYKEI